MEFKLNYFYNHIKPSSSKNIPFSSLLLVLFDTYIFMSTLKEKTPIACFI